MNRPGPIVLAAVTAVALAAMAASLFWGDWLFDLYWYWWVPALGLGSLCLLTWETRRWWLMGLLPLFLLPLLGRIWFSLACSGPTDCI